MKKFNIFLILTLILSLCLIPVFADVQTGIPAVINGLKTFTGGIRIGADPNNAFLSNGNITAKTIYSNGLIYSQGDGIASTSNDRIVLLNGSPATVEVPVQMSPSLRLTGKVWNTTGAGSSESSSWIIQNLPISGTTPSSLLKFGYSANGAVYSYPFTIDNSGSITAGADTDTTFTFGRGKVWGDSDFAYFSHYDCANTTNYFIRQASNGTGVLSSPKYIDINNGTLTVVRVNSSGLHVLSGRNIKYNGDAECFLSTDRPTTANTAGNALTVQSGGCTTLATDKAGGNLLLKSGISTGTGTSQIDFYTATAGSTGTSDNTPSLKLSLNSNGDLIPGIDNNSYIGKNDDDTPFAYKGVILKDTTNGKYYRLEIVNGVVTATDLTD